MKIKCHICGTVEETYPDSPNHILKLCNKHWHEQRYKKMEDFITWFYENHEMEYTKYHYEFLKSTGQLEGVEMYDCKFRHGDWCHHPELCEELQEQCNYVFPIGVDKCPYYQEG